MEFALAALDAVETVPTQESHDLPLQRLTAVELSPADLDDGRVQRRPAQKRLHTAKYLQLGALHVEYLPCRIHGLATPSLLLLL